MSQRLFHILDSTIVFQFSVAALLIFVMAQTPLARMMGEWEGMRNPAVTQVTITKIETLDDHKVRIWGEFYRPRNECNFRGLEWWLGTPRKNVPVDVIFEEGSVNREGGWHTFGPWVLSISERELREQSFADAVHDCHPGYQTVSTFFP